MHRVARSRSTRSSPSTSRSPRRCSGRERERYEWTVCAPRPGAGALQTASTSSSPHGSEALARADTVIVPGIGDRAGRCRRRPLARCAAARARRARRVDLHRRVRARRRRAARRPPRDDALALRRGARARFPRRRRRPGVLYVDEGDVLTSAGVAAGIDLCLHLVRARPRRRGRERGRAPDGRRRAPRRRAGAVRRAPAAGVGAATPRRHARVDGGAAGRAADRRGDGAPRRLQPALLRPPVPRRDRHDAAAVADRAAGRGGAAAARGDRAQRRGGRRARGFGGAVALRQHFGGVVGTSPTAPTGARSGAPRRSDAGCGGLRCGVGVTHDGVDGVDAGGR